jgi:hypothetical protein
MRLPDSPIDAGFEITETDFEVPSTPEQISLYRSLIGSIGYTATTCRFDISYAMSMLSRYLGKPNARVIDVTKRVIRYLLKAKDLGMTWKVEPKDKTTGFANTLFGATDASQVTYGICNIHEPWCCQLQVKATEYCHVVKRRIGVRGAFRCYM